MRNTVQGRQAFQIAASKVNDYVDTVRDWASTLRQKITAQLVWTILRSRSQKASIVGSENAIQDTHLVRDPTLS